MGERKIPFYSVVLLVVGVDLIALSVAGKIDSSLGLSGMVICLIGGSIRLRKLSGR